MNELTINQRLAVLTAMQKDVKEAISEVRAEADRATLDLYETTGAKQFTIKLGDVKVGTISVKDGGGSWVVTDRNEFKPWAEENGFIYHDLHVMEDAYEDVMACLREAGLDGFVQSEWFIDDAWKNKLQANASVPVTHDGEIVPGVEWFANRPSTMLTGCKPNDVKQAAKSLGGDVQRLALGGGSDD